MDITDNYVLEDFEDWTKQQDRKIKFSQFISVSEYEKPAKAAVNRLPHEKRAKEMVKELNENFLSMTAVDSKWDGGMKPTKNIYKRKYLSDGKVELLCEVPSPKSVKLQQNIGSNIGNKDQPSPRKRKRLNVMRTKKPERQSFSGKSDLSLRNFTFRGLNWTQPIVLNKNAPWDQLYQNQRSLSQFHGKNDSQQTVSTSKFKQKPPSAPQTPLKNRPRICHTSTQPRRPFQNSTRRFEPIRRIQHPSEAKIEQTVRSTNMTPWNEQDEDKDIDIQNMRPTTASGYNNKSALSYSQPNKPNRTQSQRPDNNRYENSPYLLTGMSYFMKSKTGRYSFDTRKRQPKSQQNSRTIFNSTTATRGRFK